MSEDMERRQGYGWLWVVGILAAVIGGLVVYARMKPETAVAKRVNGATVTLWEAMRRCCHNGEGTEAEQAALPSESRWAS